MIFIIIIQNISQAFMLAFYIILILKGVQFLKKLEKMFHIQQSTYFKTLANISTNRKTERIVFLKMLLILCWNIYITGQCIRYIFEDDWMYACDIYFQHLLSCLPHYIMWHHVFTLCYIDKLFSKLNNQLECYQVQEHFVDTHKQLSLLMQESNDMYGPILISALAYLLVSHSIHACVTLRYIIIPWEYTYLYEFIVELLQYIQATRRDTRRIIKKYISRNEDPQV